MVGRLTCDKDGRGCYAVLTEQGQVAVDQARSTYIAVVRTRFVRHFSIQEMQDSQSSWRARCRRARLRHPSPRRRDACPHRHAAARPRRGPHARLRPARHQGRGQDARGLRGRRARLRHGARQHVPSVPHARSRADPAARRPPSLHALGPPGDHRLGRLPGLLDGPRRRRRRDQGPPGPRRAHRLDPRDRRGGRALPLLPRRLRAVHGARDVDGDPGRAALRHRARVRRVHAVQRHPRVHRALDRAHAPLARPLPRLARRARPGRPDDLRDRPGRGRGGPAARVGPGGRRPRPGRDRDRRHAGGGQAADVRGRRVGGLRAAGLPPPPPARDRRDRRPAARRRARHRHVRLRDADPHRPPRDGGRAGPGSALAGRSRQGPLPRGRRADPRRLPMPGLRARLLPRLPALPAEGPRVDRVKAADDPQPCVHPDVDGGAAWRHRGGTAR